MKEFCQILAFSLTLTAMIVTFSVALWNEGCNKRDVPHPVRYTGRSPDSDRLNSSLPMLNTNNRILVIPMQ